MSQGGGGGVVGALWVLCQSPWCAGGSGCHIGAGVSTAWLAPALGGADKVGRGWGCGKAPGCSFPSENSCQAKVGPTCAAGPPPAYTCLLSTLVLLPSPRPLWAEMAQPLSWGLGDL